MCGCVWRCLRAGGARVSGFPRSRDMRCRLSQRRPGGGGAVALILDLLRKAGETASDRQNGPEAAKQGVHSAISRLSPVAVSMRQSPVVRNVC